MNLELDTAFLGLSDREAVPKFHFGAFTSNRDQNKPRTGHCLSRSLRQREAVPNSRLMLMLLQAIGTKMNLELGTASLSLSDRERPCPILVSFRCFYTQ